jgi:hypothetical protein
MPRSKVLGSRLYLIRSDLDANQHSQVIVFGHGAGPTGGTFSTVGGATIRFCCPNNRNLYTASTDTLQNFGFWSARAEKKHPEWTFIPGPNVPDYYLTKATGYHLGYKDLRGANEYPSQQKEYLSKKNIERKLSKTLTEYDIVIVRARNTQFNRKSITLSEVVEKLKNNGYAHATIHCFHCRGDSDDISLRYDFQEEMAGSGIKMSNYVSSGQGVSIDNLTDALGDDTNINFGEVI